LNIAVKEQEIHDFLKDNCIRSTVALGDAGLDDGKFDRISET